MGRIKSEVVAWSYSDHSFDRGDAAKIPWSNVIEPDVSSVNAGYVQVNDATAEHAWTETPGHEIMWVMSGIFWVRHREITHELHEGDMIFIREGATVNMRGTLGAKAAYVGRIP
jgi:ethanolamine utilization protein EutQ (cupin superfamily)